MNPKHTIDLATFRLSDFEPHWNTSFSVVTEDGGSLALTLCEGSEYPDDRMADQSGRKPFCLIFLCTAAVIPPCTYRLEHAVLGSMDLFLSPFAAAGDGCKLEAIFN